MVHGLWNDNSNRNNRRERHKEGEKVKHKHDDHDDRINNEIGFDIVIIINSIITNITTSCRCPAFVPA